MSIPTSSDYLSVYCRSHGAAPQLVMRRTWSTVSEASWKLRQIVVALGSTARFWSQWVDVRAPIAQWVRPSPPLYALRCLLHHRRRGRAQCWLAPDRILTIQVSIVIHLVAFATAKELSSHLTYWRVSYSRTSNFRPRLPLGLEGQRRIRVRIPSMAWGEDRR